MSVPLQATGMDGVVLIPLARHSDSRGWLVELFRQDELSTAGLDAAMPAMAYLSLTHSGVARGPHEHDEQTDCFAFLGPSDFTVHLWDNRSASPTKGLHVRMTLGQCRPSLLIVPPHVVHAYVNNGGVDGVVFNLPNRLYRGWGRHDDVDEVRYESDPESPFRLEGAE